MLGPYAHTIGGVRRPRSRRGAHRRVTTRLAGDDFEIGLLTVDMTTLGVMAAILALLDLVLYITSRATFRREQILTNWK